MVCSRTWSEEPRERSLVGFLFLLRKAIEGIKGKLMCLHCFQLPVSMAKNWNAEHCYDSMLIVFLQFQIPFNFSLVFSFCFFFFSFVRPGWNNTPTHPHPHLRALHTESEISQQRDKLITSVRINELDNERSPRGFPRQPILAIIADRTGDKISQKISTEA